MSIAFDAAAGGDNGGGTNTITFAHTCTGSNLGLVVGIYGDEVPTTVTYSGTSMALIGQNTPLKSISVWYLDGPATGSNNVVVTMMSNQTIHAVSSSYTGVKGSGQPDANVFNSSVFTTSITQAIITITDNSWTVMCADSSTSSATTAGSGSTLRWTNIGSTGGALAILDSAAPITPAGSYSMTASNGNGSSIWATGVLALAPLGGGGGTNHNALTLLGVG